MVCRNIIITNYFCFKHKNVLPMQKNYINNSKHYLALVSFLNSVVFMLTFVLLLLHVLYSFLYA